MSGAPSMRSDRPLVGLTPTALGRSIVGLSRQLPLAARQQEGGTAQELPTRTTALPAPRYTDESPAYTPRSTSVYY